MLDWALQHKWSITCSARKQPELRGSQLLLDVSINKEMRPQNILKIKGISVGECRDGWHGSEWQQGVNTPLRKSLLSSQQRDVQQDVGLIPTLSQ